MSTLDSDFQGGKTDLSDVKDRVDFVVIILEDESS